MTEEHQNGRETRQYSVSLFPEHDAIVRRFADESHRRYSNALQFIIEDWARQKRADIATAAPTPEPEAA